MKTETLNELKKIVDEAKFVVFIGGAGVSVPSGIPDFRSPGGLYSRKREDGMRYEELLSSDYFYADPKGFYDFYWKEMVLPNARPNAAHKALVELEKRGKRVSVLTQNIDGLHTLAGSKEVHELHGSTLRYHCLKCHKPYRLDELNTVGVPTCPVCGGLIKPDVVLYGEGLPMSELEAAEYALSHGDLLIVAGTSLTVYPVASLPYYFRGKTKIIINREPTGQDSLFHYVIHEDCAEVLPLICQ